MEKSFEFSYCLDEVEFVEYMENITEEESIEIVKKLMKSDEIYVGERTKGMVSFNDSVQPIVYDVNYEYYEGPGEDWGDDEWVVVVTQVQL